MTLQTNPVFISACLVFSIAGMLIQIVNLALAPGLTDWKSVLSYALRRLTCCASMLIWSLLLTFLLVQETFADSDLSLLRWSMLLAFFFSLFDALIEHEWQNVISGILIAFTLPLFETAFGAAIFPIFFLLILILHSVWEIYSLYVIRKLRFSSFQAHCVQQGLDSMADGILFATESGTILLKNQTMESLCRSVCRQKLKNANRFWNALTLLVSGDMLTKIEHDGSYLIRFEGGNTWTFYRETHLINGVPCIQYTALNVTESDKLQKATLLKKLEADRQAASVQNAENLQQELIILRNRRSSLVDALDSVCRKILDLYSHLPGKPEDCGNAAIVAEGTAAELRQIGRRPADADDHGDEDVSTYESGTSDVPADSCEAASELPADSEAVEAPGSADTDSISEKAEDSVFSEDEPVHE